MHTYENLTDLFFCIIEIVVHIFASPLCVCSLLYTYAY